MARVEITLNGRVFPIACADGQEDRVRAVAALVEGYIDEIKGEVRSLTDMHLLVMVCLMLGDELMDLRDEKRVPSRDDPELERTLAALAERIDGIAARLGST
jgi:cell division protein ZapA